jgi:hypothetical protein
MTHYWMLVGPVLALCATSVSADCAPWEFGDGFHPVVGAQPTIRLEAARLPRDGAILYGTIANPTRDEDGRGRTDFLVTKVLREGQGKAPTKLVLSAYLPVEDSKKPPHYLMFCDRDEGQLAAYRGIRLTGGARSVEYVKKALALDLKKPADSVAFYFAHLEDADPEVAKDAFYGVATASDRDLFAAAHKFSAQKLRAWLKNPKTPAGRLYLYGQLLVACGKQDDAKYLRELLESEEERYADADDGILLGYVWLKPKEGWKLLHARIADGKKDVLCRLHALRVARYVFQTQPTESRAKFVKAMRGAMRHPDLADVPIESLRQARVWDLTDAVLKLYGKKEFEWTTIRRAIIRYALSCPTQEPKDFLLARRRDAKDLVDEAEELLKDEDNAKKASRK